MINVEINKKKKCRRMRVGFIGCVKSSEIALKRLLDMDCIDLCGVVTRHNSKLNADFVDLESLCREHGIPVHKELKGGQQSSVNFFHELRLDIIFCIGWSFLLGNDMLNSAKHGVIGFHPAKLPQNRGRHPLIWALALGLDETASTFFRMDEGADSGDIVSQKIIKIEANDDATVLYNKMLNVMEGQLSDFVPALSDGTAVFVKQESDKATYWRKRSRKDGLIDFRMTAQSINNLVRALAYPYPGAEIEWRGEFFKVFKSSVSKQSYPLNIEPGFVLDVCFDKALVKTCSGGAIWLYGLEDVGLQEGDYL